MSGRPSRQAARRGMREARACVLGMLTVTATWPCFAGEHTVSQSEKQFSQEQITIKAGDTILFKNEDSVAHNLFSRSDGFKFNLKKQEPGTENAIPFESAGTAEVRCAIHPKMKLVVTVEP